jgi:phytanoyl-CoA dioxygenase PhyH
MNMHTTDVSTLDRDGYVVLNGILPPAQVEQARQDLAKLFDQDVDSRKQRGFTEPYFADGPVGPTILTAPSHLALDMYGKSAAFDQLLEQMLTHPRVQRVVEAWCGPHFRIGSVNIRYMTGAIDPPPAHELHRDGPYSMNLCIMLSDVEPGENAATALVPGSHWSALDPRWDTLFEKPFRLSKNPAKSGLSFFLTWNIFNRIFRAKSFKNVTGAFGKQGDVYFFPNGEVWHGRLPNMNGRRTMICLMGCSAVTPESAVKPVAASKEILAKLPPRLAQGLGGPFQVNDASNTLIDRLYKTRQPAAFSSLEYWSKLERRIAEWISGLVRR